MQTLRPGSWERIKNLRIPTGLRRAAHGSRTGFDQRESTSRKNNCEDKARFGDVPKRQLAQDRPTCVLLRNLLLRNRLNIARYYDIIACKYFRAIKIACQSVYTKQICRPSKLRFDSILMGRQPDKSAKCCRPRCRIARFSTVSGPLSEPDAWSWKGRVAGRTTVSRKCFKRPVNSRGETPL